MLNLASNSRVAAWILAFLFGSAASAVVIGVLTQGSSQDTTMFDIGFDPTDPGEDLLQPGHQVSMAMSDAAIGFELIRPHHASASDAALTEVWIGDAGADEVGLRYNSGLRAYLTKWPAGGDPASFYKSQAAESGAGTYIEINGHPAWVVGADEQAKGYPPTSVVDLSIGDVEISLQADVPPATLMEIAATVS